MKCRDFELIVPLLARNRAVDAGLESGLAHAEGCDRCTTRLVQERTLFYGVRAVITDMASVEPSLRVETALLAAFNDHFAPLPSSTSLSTLAKKRPGLHFRLAFGFAILLLLISIPSIFWLPSRSGHRQSEAMAQNNPAAGPTAESPSLVDPPKSVTVRRNSVTPRRQKRMRPSIANRPNVSEPNAPEEVTEFFPLADGEDLTSLEAAQVARVELPVSALIELGLRIGPEISAGQIKADIIMGLDGSARAIRFVR